MKRDDTLWKGILENVFDDFLRFFFKDAEKLFDINKGFEFLDKELEQLFPDEDMPHPRFVDKLVKVFTKDDQEEWLLVHIEVQGYKDDDFPLRMYRYFYRILDKYRKPVTAIAILTDTNKNFHPTTYHYHHLGTSNTFHYNTYKVIEQEEGTLAKSDNPFAIVVLTVLLMLKKKPLTDENLFSLKLEIVRNLQRHNIPEKKRRALMNFLKFYAGFANPEFYAKFDKTILTITKNKKTMGIEEMLVERFKKEGEEKGMQKGIEKGKTAVVKNLLMANKFTITEIADFADVTEAFVRKVKKSLK
jgi:predicted transposase YdaD